MFVLVDLAESFLVIPFEVDAVGLRVTNRHILFVEVQGWEVQIVHLIFKIVHARVLSLRNLRGNIAAKFGS